MKLNFDVNFDEMIDQLDEQDLRELIYSAAEGLIAKGIDKETVIISLIEDLKNS